MDIKVIIMLTIRILINNYCYLIIFRLPFFWFFRHVGSLVIDILLM